MKNISTILMLLAVSILITIDVYSEIKDQNTLCIEVDPKYAKTIFIETDDELKVETWNEEYILFQITVEPFSETSEVLNFLANNKKNIIKQEFTINDFLFLTIPNLSEILNIKNSNFDRILSYKITVPKKLELELRCKNDLTNYFDFLESPKNDGEKYSQKN